MIRVVACAAIRHRITRSIICGVRHGDCLNFATRYRVGEGSGSEVWECGFMDQHYKFMTRAEAWKVADAAGQIRRPSGYERQYDPRPAGVGDEGLLFSENLY